MSIPGEQRCVGPSAQEMRLVVMPPYEPHTQGVLAPLAGDPTEIHTKAATGVASEEINAELKSLYRVREQGATTRCWLWDKENLAQKSKAHHISPPGKKMKLIASDWATVCTHVRYQQSLIVFPRFVGEWGNVCPACLGNAPPHRCTPSFLTLSLFFPDSSEDESSSSITVRRFGLHIVLRP